MQQLDNLEIWKVPQEPPSEEPVGDVDEMNQSPDDPEKVDGPPLLSSEGSSGAKSILEVAPPSARCRPASAEVEDHLPNGEMQDGDLFGNGCSPEEAKGKATPGAAEEGDHRLRQGSSEAASAANPAGQSSGPSKAPAGRQRKLAMEEIVIRDHLGQEVGCMDAVGQTQGSLEKEEELEGHMDVGDRCDRWSQPGPVERPSDQKEALGEGPLDHELGGREGPEGQSPTSQDHQGPSGLLQNKNSGPKGQGDGPLAVGSLAKEAGGKGVGQKAVPGQGAREMEPTLAPATGDAPTTESVEQGGQMETPEWQASGAREEGQGHKRPVSPLEKPTPLQGPSRQEVKDLFSQEEATMTLLDPVLPSLPTQILVMPQDKVPSLQGMKESLLQQIPSSLQGNEGSLLDQELSFLSNGRLLPPLDSFLPESKGSLLDQTPSSFQGCLSEQNPPSLQDPVSSSLEIKSSPLQGEVPRLPDVKHSMTGQVLSSLHETNRSFSCRSPTHTGIQITSLLDQPISPLSEDEPLVLEDIPSSWHEMGKPVPQQEQELCEHEVKGSLPDSVPSLTNQPFSSPDPIVSLQEAKIPATEEAPGPLQDPMPVPPEAPVSPLPEAEVFLPSQVPPSVDDPCESPIVLLDHVPSALRDMESTSPVGKTPASSPQEADGALPDEIQTLLPIHTSPNLPEDEISSPDQAPPTSEDQTSSQLGQTLSFQDAAKSLPEGQNSSDHTLAEQTPSPNKAQSPELRDASICPNALPSSSQETLQPLLDKIEALETQGAKDSGDASLASAGEITEVLESLHTEQQPLLKEGKASGAPADISTGDPQSKAGISKPPGAARQQAPNHSPHTSANTASSHQFQAALPCQEEDQEPEKGKHKSCQCCILM